MRLDTKSLHPSFAKAIRDTVWSGGVGRDPKMLAAYQTEWFKAHGAGCAAYVLASVTTVLASTIALKTSSLPGPAKGFTVLALAMAFTFVAVLAMVRHSRSLSIPEIQTLLPTLDLTEAGRAYGETLVVLHRIGRPKAEIDETLATLNALLDEEARLLALRGRIVGGDEGDRLARLEAERTVLSAKTESTMDAAARDAYNQSLSLMDERLAGLRSAGTGLERIDAHLELLRQAVLATRDAARRLETTPVTTAPDLETDSLRAAVALARAQTGETERALAELRAV